MIIDNSMAKAFRLCPRYYWEKYEAPNSLETKGIEFDYSKTNEPSTTAFGTRIHSLLADHYNMMADGNTNSSIWMPQTPADELIEAEAQVMMADYRATYPTEDWDDILYVENQFYTALPSLGLSIGPHTLTWKADVIYLKDNKLFFMDHKSEKRGSESNVPEMWAARDQVSLYQWAIKKQFPEYEFGGIILNVLTRQSPKGQIGPMFRRDRLERDEQYEETAIRNIVYVAEEIEKLRAGTNLYPNGSDWPYDSEKCRQFKRNCEYYPLHILGKSEANLSKYKPTERYIDF